MGWRTVVVSKTSKLDYKMGYLCIRSNDEMKRIYISEIAVLLIESTAVSLTAYLLVELANQGVNVIFCDSRMCPHGIYVSLYGSHDTSDKIRKQIRWTEDAKKTIWKYVVMHKIEGQMSVLELFSHQEEKNKLNSYIPEIELGDSTNREGHAAKVYFNALFGKDYTRTNKDEIVNAALNYGYSILLSSVAREIVCNGYITQIGIFHDNMFNGYNLACDLMEPYRPFIDIKVLQMKIEKLEHEEKIELTNVLNSRVVIDGREQFLSNALCVYVNSILDAIDKNEPELIKFPEYDIEIYANNSIL
jgi:CRISPR-associated endonuclease Cas1